MKLSHTERKIQGVIKVKISGIKFEIKRVTPEDCLDKQGIPISNWQMESERFLQERSNNTMTLGDLKKSWVRLFDKAILSIDGLSENLSKMIDRIGDNVELSNSLYNKIIEHSMGVKKKAWLLRIFQSDRL